MHKFLILLFVLPVMACSNPEASNDQVKTETILDQKGSVQLIAVNEFESKLESEDVIVIDVRTDGEVSEGVIPGAIQIDFYEQDQFKAKVAELDKSKEILVYCKVGGRSAQAATYMGSQGLTVYDLQGGIMAWKEAGKELKELE